jgi:hypothetical protein
MTGGARVHGGAVFGLALSMSMDDAATSMLTPRFASARRGQLRACRGKLRA